MARMLKNLLCRIPWLPKQLWRPNTNQKSYGDASPWQVKAGNQTDHVCPPLLLPLSFVEERRVTIHLIIFVQEKNMYNGHVEMNSASAASILRLKRTDIPIDLSSGTYYVRT